MSDKENIQDTERTTIMEFPCNFIIKMMGKNNKDFREAAKAIVQKQFGDSSVLKYKEVPSKDDNYVAISVEVFAQSQTELDVCYQALTDEPLVLIAL